MFHPRLVVFDIAHQAIFFVPHLPGPVFAVKLENPVPALLEIQPVADLGHAVVVPVPSQSHGPHRGVVGAFLFR